MACIILGILPRQLSKLSVPSQNEVQFQNSTDYKELIPEAKDEFEIKKGTQKINE
jgi:hypothetical protein